jgi:hypothetical protein
VKEILFNVAYDPHYEGMQRILLPFAAHGELEGLVLASACSTNPLHVRNAYAVAFHVFATTTEPRLSPLTRQKLKARALKWIEDPQCLPALKQALLRLDA